MGHQPTLVEIQALRDERYHCTPALRLHTEEDAVAFVDEIGFCFLFGDQSIEMPSLWAAVCGVHRPVPVPHDDADLGRTWDWKDTLPARGLVHYGKLLRRKPMLVSLALLPTFYALSPNYGELDDYLERYAEGRLSHDAKLIYEVLLAEGPLATTHLRQLAGLPGGGTNARRFDHALTELQVELRIVKSGISDANRWGYAYVYDLFLRRYPDVPERARRIGTGEAMETLLMRYLRNVVAVPESAAKRLFDWEPFEWEPLLARLAERGALRRQVEIEGLGADCLLSTGQ
ncbi:MAG: hypothetical protein GX557_06480 [Chloroflexi bacterium]|nr:hypothetical protein [Chloroflexota bacterium]